MASSKSRLKYCFNEDCGKLLNKGRKTYVEVPNQDGEIDTYCRNCYDDQKRDGPRDRSPLSSSRSSMSSSNESLSSISSEDLATIVLNIPKSRNSHMEEDCNFQL